MFVKGASKEYKTRALIIFIIGFITMYFSGMFGTDIINVIQTPITEKLSCTNTQAVLGWTIGGYSVIALAFVFSTIIMNKGVRGFATLSFFIMAVGAVLVGIGYSNNSLILITIGGFLLKNFVQALQIAVFQVVARWFLRTRGFILGLIGASFALDNSTSSSGLTIIYNGIGFNGMMVVVAVVMVVLGVLNFIFVRTAPEEIALTIDGLQSTGEKKGPQIDPSMERKSRWDLKGLVKIRESWCIMIACGVFNMTLTAVVSQFFSSLMGMGVEQSMCMTYMVIFGLLGIPMSPVYGKLIDKIGASKTGVVGAALYCLSVAGFCFNIPIIAALGLTFFVAAPILQPALTMYVFGGKEYQSANRYLTIVVNIIAACGIPFMTIFKDLTGSYSLAYYVLLIMNILALVMMVQIRKTYAED